MKLIQLLAALLLTSTALAAPLTAQGAQERAPIIICGTC